MADSAAIRAAIAANLSALPNIQVSAQMLASPTPPAIHVVNGPATYDLAMARGMDELWFIVHVFVGLVSDKGAQVKLDAYRAGSGATSVKAAIEADKTLGGTCFDARVVEVFADQQFIRSDGVAILMAEFRVRVLARGN